MELCSNNINIEPTGFLNQKYKNANRLIYSFHSQEMQWIIYFFPMTEIVQFSQKVNSFYPIQTNFQMRELTRPSQLAG